MENSEGKDSSQCVRVAVNIRPLITPELLIGCTDCVTLIPGEPQVQIGTHAFTFDNVYGGSGHPSSRIFDDCVAPLVDALFNGYNATVLAYGQTGSGKTYTMGTNYNGEENNVGVIPRVMEAIFSRVETLKESNEFLIRVSFIEIFKEEVFDLLDTNSHSQVSSRADGIAKSGVPARVPIQIRETVNGGITLAGVTEAAVRKKEEMASYLSRGSLSRATGSTNMNSQSSRSHAIFTISMEQKRVLHSSSVNDDVGEDILSAKLHLVDLAGSERAKRTGADGMRFKEGVHINKGLLALGNVISALGDDKKRHQGGHVPYRDSKLTRLLQDSLGGNSKTVMIACVSPADTNAEETLNTLKYSNRARNIQNKAVVNRDPATAQMQKMRSQIEQLQAELLYFRGDASAPFEELQILKHKVSLLEASNEELQQELQQQRISSKQLSQRAVDAQVEKDNLILKIESAKSGKPWDEIDITPNQDSDLLKTYVSRIQELEGELQRYQSSKSSKRTRFIDRLDSEDDHEYSATCLPNDVDLSSEIEDKEKELEHSSMAEILHKELKELDQTLEQKEAEMKRFSNVETSVLKQHYEKKVHELELEKRRLQREIDELRNNLTNIPSSPDDGAKKLKEDYLQKLNVLEAQVAELKKKQEAQGQLLRQKQKSDEAAKRLQDEIQRIKSQKVQLQHKIKQESEQFRLWKASREKEVLQLKKEGRRNEFEMHKLVALNQRQKMVLQRKTEEASLATKRLKELLEARKASSRDVYGAGSGHGAGIQALMQTIEHELEVTVQVHEVRSEYDRQMEERSKMAKEIAKLKEEAYMLKQNDSSPQMLSPGARNSRIFALENMLATSSSTLVSMASQLSEAAEEREKISTGRGRWNQVRSLPEAKNLMNYLFNLTSSSRCLLWDREADCREKDAEIRDLKEKVVELASSVRQLEDQKVELMREVKSLLNSNKYIEENAHFGHKYHLRNSKGTRNSLMLLEDMNTSDSEHSDMEAADDDWVESARQVQRKRNSKTGCHSSQGSSPTEDQCCSCSKNSLCKRSCKCRAAGGVCGPSCNCAPSKCTNREASSPKGSSKSAQLEEAEVISVSSGNEETEKSDSLVSRGAMLLQNALADKPAEDYQEPRRKPLSDIGNTVAKSNAPRPGQRKKWKTATTIQLVPTAPPSQPESRIDAAAPKRQEHETRESDISSMPSRAMQSAALQPNNNPLRERNSDHPEESAVVRKEHAGTGSQRGPAQQPRPSHEKENRKGQ